MSDKDFVSRWSYRLVPALEGRFLSETEAGRNRQIRFWIGVSLGFSWLTLLGDLAAVPDMWWLAFALRACLVTPVTVVAMRLLKTTQPRGLEAFASIAPSATVVLAPLIGFAASANVDTLLPGVVLFISIFWVNVLTPMRFHDTVIFTVAMLVSGNAINITSAFWHHAAFVDPNVIVTSDVLIALSLLARFLAERESRHSFVLGLTIQVHAEDLARSNAQLLEMSNTDPLTGLGNRRFFDLSLSQAWQAATIARTCVAVMMIDVDHFKMFNDTAGHLEGDRCLSTVALAIADHVRRGNDLPARFGGEEFVVLMPATDQDEAFAIAERVRGAVTALQIFHPGRTCRGFVSVSIGVASRNPAVPGATSTELLAAADEAMYAAKAAGRDQVMHARRWRHDANAAS